MQSLPCDQVLLSFMHKTMKIGVASCSATDGSVIEHRATITVDGLERPLYFTLSNAEGLLAHSKPHPEAFLLAMLMPAMERGVDIECQEPIDEELLYSLNTQLIPLLCSYHSKLTPIRVKAPAKTRGRADQVESGRLSVLAMSCGLDALTAYAELTQPEEPSWMRPQAFMMNNIGAFGKGPAKYAHDLELVQRFAADRGLPLFQVASNMSEFYAGKYDQSHSFRNAAAAWALGDACRRVTLASGMEYKVMQNIVGRTDLAYRDPVILPMLSTSALEVYSSGCQHSRSAKFEIWLSRPELHPYLNTCLRSTDRKGGYINCGTCKKCAELLLRAEALNRMPQMAQVFNVEAFRSQRWYQQYKVVYNAFKRAPSANSVDTLDFLRRHRGRVSGSAYLLGRVVAAGRRAFSF